MRMSVGMKDDNLSIFVRGRGISHRERQTVTETERAELRRTRGKQ